MEKKSAKRAAWKWIALAVAAIAIAWFLRGCAQPIASGSFDYRLIDNDTAIEITGFRGGGGALQIPSHFQGLPVTRIGDDTFSRRSGAERSFTLLEITEGRRRLNAVTIPDTVTRIGRYAFRENRLREVSFPDSVTRIEFGAFARNRFASIDIGNGVTHIERNAFASNRLVSVDIPSTVVYLAGFTNNRIRHVYISYGVRYIGEWAFRHNRLREVTIPDSVAEIGEMAFRNNRLREVSVPRHTIVSDNAFDRRVTVTRRD